MKHKSGAKALSLILSLVMLLALVPSVCITALAADSYQLWIGGDEVTTEKLSGGGWTYDPETHTLTLTDYSNNKAYYVEPEAGVYDSKNGYRIAAGIYYSGTEKLTVSLAGTNALTMPDLSEDKLDNAAIFSTAELIFTGTGSLSAAGGAASDSSDESSVSSFGMYVGGGKTIVFEGGGAVAITGGSGESSYGAYVTKSTVTVTGEGQVTFTGGAAVRESAGYYGEWGGVRVEGGQLTAAGGTVTGAKGKSWGISSGMYDITVKDGKLDAVGGSVAGESGKSYGLYSIIGPCYFDDGAKVDCKGGDVSGDGGESFGIRSAGIYANGGDVTARGASADTSCGVYNDISIKIEDGTLTAEGGPAVRSYGIYSKDLMEMSAGAVTASGGDATENSSGLFLAARAYTDGTTDGGTITVTGAELTVSGGMYGIYCDPLFDGKVIVITDGTVTASGNTVSMSKAPIFGSSVTASGSTSFDGSEPTEYAENDNGSYKWVKTIGDPNPKTAVTGLLFTVEEPAAGTVPDAEVQIATVPENALVITEYDAEWFESEDGLDYKPMSSPTFEAGKYYALNLPNENNAGAPVVALAAPGYAISEEALYTVNGEEVIVFTSYLAFFGPLQASPVAVAEADIKEIYGNSVFFTGVEGQEYVIVPKGATPADDDWLPENGMKIPNAENEVTFFDLEPVTEYEIYTRVAQSESASASEPVKTEVMTVLEGFGIGSEGFGNAVVGETFTLYPEPERDELTFQWYTFEEEIEFGQTPAEITPIPGATGTTYTLKAEDVGKRFGAKAFKNGKEVAAIFETDPVSYATVTFDSMGGSEVAPVTGLTCGVKIEKPADPVREGYTFDGWYQEEECTTPWDFDKDFVGFANTVLYAKWTQNDNSSVPGSTDGDGEQTANTSPRTGDDSRTGLWITLTVVSLCALAATVFIGKKKRAFDK